MDPGEVPAGHPDPHGVSGHPLGDLKPKVENLLPEGSGPLPEEPYWRGLALDDQLVEAVTNAPTVCGVCGATFDQRITSGMNQMKCDYCGSVTRIGR